MDSTRSITRSDARASNLKSTHRREHVLCCSQQFFVGHVVDDLGRTDAGCEHEGAAAAALLLVAGGERDKLVRRCLEWWDWAIAQDEVCHAREVVVRNAFARERKVQRGDHAPGDGLSMQ